MAKTFDDLRKPVKDIFGGYPDDRVKIDVDTGKDGVSFKPSITVNGDNDVSGKLSYGFQEGKCPFGFNSSMDTSGKLTGTADFGKLYKGVSVKTTGEYNITSSSGEKVTTDLKFSHGNTAMTGKFTYAGGNLSLASSAAVGYQKFHAGADVNFDVSASALKGYNAAVSYDGEGYTLVGSLNDSGNSFVAGYAHTVNDKLSVAGEYTHNVSKGCKKVAVGMVKKLNADTTLRAKANSCGAVSVGYALKVDDSTKANIGTEFSNAFNAGEKTNVSFNIGVTFKP